MAQRISRAKARLREVDAPFAVPPAASCPARVAAVAHVLYLVFTEGHTSTPAAGLTDVSLAGEAIRLTRRLHDLLPGDPEVTGLLALMLLTDARRPARLDAAGALVPLAEQDRSRWDARPHRRGRRARRGRAAAAGRSAPTSCRRPSRPCTPRPAPRPPPTGPRSRSSTACSPTSTPGPVVTLNHAVAVGEARGPEAALAMLDAAVRRARRCAAPTGCTPCTPTSSSEPAALDEARAAYAEAARLATSVPEQRYLQALASR